MYLDYKEVKFNIFPHFVTKSIKFVIKSYKVKNFELTSEKLSSLKKEPDTLHLISKLLNIE